jgi:hypothetical protein
MRHFMRETVTLSSLLASNELVRQNVTPFFERSPSAESASLASIGKFYDSNAPRIKDKRQLSYLKCHIFAADI